MVEFTKEEFFIFESIQNLLIKYDLKSLKFSKTQISITNNNGKRCKFKFSNSNLKKRKYNKLDVTNNKKIKLQSIETDSDESFLEEEINALNAYIDKKIDKSIELSNNDTGEESTEEIIYSDTDVENNDIGEKRLDDIDSGNGGSASTEENNGEGDLESCESNNNDTGEKRLDDMDSGNGGRIDEEEVIGERLEYEGESEKITEENNGEGNVESCESNNGEKRLDDMDSGNGGSADMMVIEEESTEENNGEGEDMMVIEEQEIGESTEENNGEGDIESCESNNNNDTGEKRLDDSWEIINGGSSDMMASVQNIQNNFFYDFNTLHFDFENLITQFHDFQFNFGNTSQIISSSLNTPFDAENSSSLNTPFDVENSSSIENTSQIISSSTLNTPFDFENLSISSSLNTPFDAENSSSLNTPFDVENPSSIENTSQIISSSSMNTPFDGKNSSSPSKSKVSEKIKNLKLAITSSENPDYRANNNLAIKKNIDLLNIFQNCIDVEIRMEGYNCELLEKYYRTGAYLDNIYNRIRKKFPQTDANNIVTGIIKVTGILSAFIGVYGDKDSTRQKANRFYNKSLRVFKSYEFFPNSIAQIYRAVNVSADKLMKVGSKIDFLRFIDDMKKIMISNFDNYNIEKYTYKPCEEIDFSLITDDIILKIEAFVDNPTKADFIVI